MVIGLEYHCWYFLVSDCGLSRPLCVDFSLWCLIKRESNFRLIVVILYNSICLVFSRFVFSTPARMMAPNFPKEKSWLEWNKKYLHYLFPQHRPQLHRAARPWPRISPPTWTESWTLPWPTCVGMVSRLSISQPSSSTPSSSGSGATLVPRNKMLSGGEPLVKGRCKVINK